MNLTISGSSMLTPLFLSNNACQTELPPDRIVGLLTVHSEPGNGALSLDKVVEYNRPEHEHAMLTTARWRDFLQVDNDPQSQNMAVFGFMFDGEHSWYQLWNANREHVCWVRDNDKLNYKPFAILAMDALITLMPSWQGWLFQYPTNLKPDNLFLPIAADRIDQQLVQRIMVSDSSTNLSGVLWFLVTINSGKSMSDREIQPRNATFSGAPRCGWITQMQQ